MTEWLSKRVADVVNKIESEYVLPVIQRDFIWTEEKMELLFDSLLKGNSFGSIIVINEEKGDTPLFEFRPFTTDGSISNSQHIDILPHEQFFVIDGQQRLQTFYIGLKGTYKSKHLFFDLYSNYKKDFEFDFEISVEKLPQKLQEEREIKDCFWYSAKYLFNLLSHSHDEDVVADTIISTHKIVDDTKKRHIRKNVKAFYKSIFNMPCVGIAEITVDKTTYTPIENKQKIVDLFRRLNDGGTKLSAFDLVASTLKGFDYRMEGFLREMKEEFSDIGLTPENLIKLIFLLQDNSTKEMRNAWD